MNAGQTRSGQDMDERGAGLTGAGLTGAERHLLLPPRRGTSLKEGGKKKKQ